MLCSFVEFESAADLRTAVEKLDGREFKGQRVNCVADVCNYLLTSSLVTIALTKQIRPSPTLRREIATGPDLPEVAHPTMDPQAVTTTDVALLEEATARAVARITATATVTEVLVGAIPTLTIAATVALLRDVDPPWRTLAREAEDTKKTRTAGTMDRRSTRTPMADPTTARRGTSLLGMPAMAHVRAVTLVRTIAGVEAATGNFLLTLHLLGCAPLRYLDRGPHPIRWRNAFFFFFFDSCVSATMEKGTA